MSPQEKLTTRLYELLPHKKELKKCSECNIEVIMSGRGVARRESLHLEDLLMAIEELKCKNCGGQGGFANEGYSECGECGGDCYLLPDELIGTKFNLMDVINMYDLSKPLSAQSDEFCEFLLTLLN